MRSTETTSESRDQTPKKNTIYGSLGKDLDNYLYHNDDAVGAGTRKERDDVNFTYPKDTGGQRGVQPGRRTRTSKQPLT